MIIRYGVCVIRLLACLSLLFFLVPVTYVHGPAPKKNDSQYITLEPISFNSADPSMDRTGRLEFLAGWKMTSKNDDFGGISAMLAMPENRFLLLTDAGALIGFTLDEANNLAKRPFIAPLPDGPPKPNRHAQKNWDAEALVHNPDTGQYWVGYERQHGIWRYGPSFARKESAHRAKAMQKWPINGGAEAMLRLPGETEPDGEASPDRFLVFSESAPYKGRSYQALLFDGDPAEKGTKPKRFGYRPPKGYKITDATLLPNGDALLLHRRFTPLDGISAILSIGDLDDIAPGKIWSSRRIATLERPIKVDNMEALAVTEEGPDTIIWVASDDNFEFYQESLLMKFRLLGGKQKKMPKTKDAQNEKAEASPGFSTLQD